jgi:hypothetical protein
MMVTKAELNETLRTMSPDIIWYGSTPITGLIAIHKIDKDVYSYHTRLYSLNDITNVIGKSEDIQYFGAA